jgi:NAD(P)-dependent dehydrogenase (short-subunit alcohol dehydrogenase family)
MRALVTGSTRGIGYATAAALLGEGHQVAIMGTSGDSVARAEHALGAQCGDPGRVIGLVCDVRDAGAVELAAQTVEARFGGFEVLVNCAGVGVGAPVADLPLDEWRRIIDINLTGVFHCCRAAIPRLRAAGGGFIVNLSSLSSTGPFAGGAAYCATKAAVDAFTAALMQEVRHDGIRVAGVAPGSVDTSFGSGRDKSGWALQPADVAQVIVDLLGHASRSLPSRIEVRPSQPPRKG